MSLIGKSLSASLLSNLWLLFLLLLLTPLYVHFLGAESYGLIGFYASLVAILSILDMGISSTVTREISWRSARSDEKETIPSLVKSLEVIYWLIMLFIGFGMLIIAVFFGADWFQTESLAPNTVKVALILMIFSLVLQVPSGFYSGGFVGLQRQVQNSALLAVFVTLRGIGAIVILWKISPDIRAFFLWQIMVSLIQVNVMRRSLWKRVRLISSKPEYSSEIIKSISDFAGGMTLITGLSLTVSQVDKMILSRTVSLLDFAYYMLAWSIASVFLVVATPIVQTYGPHFTRLISSGDEESLKAEVRLASQIIGVMVIPPAAFLMILAKPVLMLWLRNVTVVDGVAPILTVMVPGSVLVACVYPVLIILYSRKQTKPVIIVHILALVILLPVLILAILHYGVLGAAFCWTLFGSGLYLSFLFLGLKTFSRPDVFTFILNNFIFPCVISFFFAAIFSNGLFAIEKDSLFILSFIAALSMTWGVALCACSELRLLLLQKIHMVRSCYF